MTKVTLTEILDSREARAAKQKDLLARFGLPIISFTMNIAGPIKTSPLIERSFYEGIRLLKKEILKHNIIYEESRSLKTGCEAFLCIDDNASHIKSICTSIEECSPLGRLFDMDAITPDGDKLERENSRSCIVCGAQGRGCSAGRLHSVEELQTVTSKIMQEYFFPIDMERCANLATESLLSEVYTTPKPGLVDMRNSGSHTDMSVETFEKSANALKPYFKECFSIGRNTASLTPKEAFHFLKKAGIEAEKVMYTVTGGVNTHKGAIYSMGILCASAGRLWTGEKPFADVSTLCQESSELVRDAVKKDFEHINMQTAGTKLYIEHGIGGIRGEVLSGFRSVTDISLPIYESLIEEGFSSNDAGIITLLHLIANTEDTNLYHRGGTSGAKNAMAKVRALLAESPRPHKEQIEALDNDFINKNLSPGGCADLLAVTYFLYQTKK